MFKRIILGQDISTREKRLIFVYNMCVYPNINAKTLYLNHGSFLRDLSLNIKISVTHLMI